MMIILNFTYDNGAVIAERELTEDEIKSVTSKLSNGSNKTITFFQGDEPPKTFEEKLAQYKSQKKDEVDKKTESLMITGFSFDNKKFGLRENEKLKWLALFKAPATKFPINLVSKEGSVLEVTSVTVIDFFNSAFDRARLVEEAGGLLKYNINQATTFEQVDAVIDNRS